jgi:hypothetical protein
VIDEEEEPLSLPASSLGFYQETAQSTGHNRNFSRKELHALQDDEKTASFTNKSST